MRRKPKLWISNNGAWSIYLIPRPRIVNNKTGLVAYPLLIDGQIVLEDTSQIPKYVLQQLKDLLK